jgi:hypothetical protein
VKIAAASLLAVSLAAVLMVYHWRPLVPSVAVHAAYEQGSSGCRDARVYRMLFRDVVFVELPDCAEADDRWFAVDLDNRLVLCPNWPERSPYLHFNHDMCLGVAVDDAVKRDGDWHVNWSGSSATWSNGKVSVHLEGP